LAKHSAWRAALEAALPPAAVHGVDADRDFGGAALGSPLRVRTRDAAELRAVLQIARRHALPVAVRGAGHSSGGHTSAASGVVLEHAPADEPLHLGADVADVPAHWTWSCLE